MKPASVKALQVLMLLVCVSHLAIGIGLNTSSTFAEWVAGVYGAEVSWTPALRYILKPLGAFMIALGVVAAVAARDPVRHRAIVSGFVVLFVLRGLQRLVFAGEIQGAFAIGPGRNFGAVAFFVVLAIALTALTLSASRGEANALDA